MKEVEYFLVSEVDRLRRLIRSAVRLALEAEAAKASDALR
jgi:hypothetical protein